MITHYVDFTQKKVDKCLKIIHNFGTTKEQEIRQVHADFLKLIKDNLHLLKLKISLTFFNAHFQSILVVYFLKLQKLDENRIIA